MNTVIAMLAIYAIAAGICAIGCLFDRKPKRKPMATFKKADEIQFSKNLGIKS